jgi:hypothetical protein
MMPWPLRTSILRVIFTIISGIRKTGQAQLAQDVLILSLFLPLV